MVKQVLEIQEFEEKKTQGGRNYTRFKTSEGWMSCFDNKSNEELKKQVGNSVSVEIVESGEFKNIKKFYGESDSADKDQKEVEVEKIKSVRNGKKEMYVSYAKDCFCAIVGRISQTKFDMMEKEEVLKLMDISVEAIKKAEIAF